MKRNSDESLRRLERRSSMNPDEDLRELEREARSGDAFAIEKWLAARRRKDPTLFMRLSEGEEPDVTARLLQARVDDGRRNADRERLWLNWAGFQPAKIGPVPVQQFLERPRWRDADDLETDLTILVAAHQVLTGLFAYEIVKQQINIEQNGYEVATSNTALVDKLMENAGRILVKNFDHTSFGIEDSSILSSMGLVERALGRGAEAIEDDLETVTYGNVRDGSELSMFTDVAGAVVALARYVATGRSEHIAVIAEIVYEIRGMDYLNESEFKEFLGNMRAPVVRRVLEFGPVLGAPKK